MKKFLTKALLAASLMFTSVDAMAQNGPLLAMNGGKNDGGKKPATAQTTKIPAQKMFKKVANGVSNFFAKKKTVEIKKPEAVVAPFIVDDTTNNYRYRQLFVRNRKDSLDALSDKMIQRDSAQAEVNRQIKEFSSVIKAGKMSPEMMPKLPAEYQGLPKALTPEVLKAFDAAIHNKAFNQYIAIKGHKNLAQQANGIQAPLVDIQQLEDTAYIELMRKVSHSQVARHLYDENNDRKKLKEDKATYYNIAFRGDESDSSWTELLVRISNENENKREAELIESITFYPIDGAENDIMTAAHYKYWNPHTKILEEKNLLLMPKNPMKNRDVNAAQRLSNGEFGSYLLKENRDGKRLAVMTYTPVDFKGYEFPVTEITRTSQPIEYISGFKADSDVRRDLEGDLPFGSEYRTDVVNNRYKMPADAVEKAYEDQDLAGKTLGIKETYLQTSVSKINSPTNRAIHDVGDVHGLGFSNRYIIKAANNDFTAIDIHTEFKHDRDDVTKKEVLNHYSPGSLEVVTRAQTASVRLEAAQKDLAKWYTTGGMDILAKTINQLAKIQDKAEQKYNKFMPNTDMLNIVKDGQRDSRLDVSEKIIQAQVEAARGIQRPVAKVVLN